MAPGGSYSRTAVIDLTFSDDEDDSTQARPTSQRKRSHGFIDLTDELEDDLPSYMPVFPEIKQEPEQKVKEEIKEEDEEPRAPAKRPRFEDRRNGMRPGAPRTRVARSPPSRRPPTQRQTPAAPQPRARSRPAAPTLDLPIATPVPLSREQRALVDLILNGARQNIFYTGAAGSGKSVVLAVVVDQFRARGDRVRLMAPTGKASLAVGGSTTWNYAGWHPGSMKRPIAKLQDEAKWGEVTGARMRDTDVIIIDEISMVENQFFERLNLVMQAARDDHRPFGGVKVIVTGDFYQLPPINPFQHCLECGKEMQHKKKYTEHRCRQHGMFFDHEKWVFRSDAWKECDFVNVFLEGIHRQTDPELKRILQVIRSGDGLSAEDRQLLADHPCDVEDAVKLFSKNEQVQELNQSELQKLPTPEHVFHCLDFFKWNPDHRHLEKKQDRSPIDGNLVALNNHQFEAKLKLKVGMPVILMVNLDLENGLVNGSQGKVVKFVSVEEARSANARAAQDPEQDGNDWQERNAIEGVPTYGGKWNKLQAEQIKGFLAQERNEHKVWPVVRFNNGQEVTIFATCRVQELGDNEPYSLISRTQIPLTAAWAITIHRSQGMTLEKVIVDLSQTFVKGQEYVALSRARSLYGLQVIGLRQNLGGPNEQVMEFIDETEWYSLD